MKLRHELKYYINLSDYYTIKSRLKVIAKLDVNANENGEYKIRSVYFDDYNDKVLFEKIGGINNRDKFRIRFYNDNHDYIRLEKKTKTNGLCKKVVQTISKTDCQKIFAGDINFMKNSDIPTYNELYVRINSELLKPKTIVDYIREAYVYDTGNVRITFDKSVRTGLSKTDIFDEQLPALETLDNRFIIMEVKYDEFLPEIMADLIQLGERTKTAISKYALCRMYG